MSADDAMQLRVVTANAVVVDGEADKVSIEAIDGWRTLLPRHVDFVAALVPGLLAYELDGVERFVAVDGGTLVKRGRSVRVAAPEAIPGDDVLALHRALRASFEEWSDTEHRARVAIAHLETDAVRRLMELEHHD
jgi:F-type H+-transporting ATPase subunit epsilon